MRIYFYLLSLIATCLLLSHCSTKQNDKGYITNGTIVCKKKVQDHLIGYNTYEYFTISNGDTSTYSFIFRYKQTFPHECKMEITNWPRYKMYLMPKTTTISCNEPDYKGFLTEMDLCLNAALNEKEQINLKYITFRLANCTDIAVKTSNIFYKGKERSITHQSILDAIQNTSLKKDFNIILNKYDLQIANEKCYEEIYIVKKSDFLNNSNYHNKYEVPDSILDVGVVLNITGSPD